MLDPEAKTLLEQIAKAARPPIHTLSAVEARRVYRESRLPLQPDPPDVASTDDRQITGPHGPISIRYYRPHGSQPNDRLPALMYFHGGGFTIGDIETHDIVCRTLANNGRCAVVSVDYRMGPEHKFPKAVDDCWAATQWVATNAGALHLDPNRLAVGGDSAGGNLATVVALLARDAGAPKLVFQLLIYPTTTLHHDTPSTKELAQGYVLTIDSMLYFREAYLNSVEDRSNWRASPLLASDVSRLPPALVLTAGYDPIKDEGKAYAEKLKTAGVEVTYSSYDGMIHGFITMGKVLRAANRALDECGAVLRRTFGT